MPIRKTLLDNIIAIIGPLSDTSNDELVKLLLYGNEAYSLEDNSSILKHTIAFLKSSLRFDIPLL